MVVGGWFPPPERTLPTLVGGVFRTFRKGEINVDFSNSSESSTKCLLLQGLPSGFLSRGLQTGWLPPQRCSAMISLLAITKPGGMHLCALLSVASSPSLGLEADLRVRLHGQHLARELVLTAVRGYLEMPRPDKALALSFHGWSGTGKNFVARMLAENLYQDGLRSNCVKMFISTLDFPHLKNVDLYEVRPAVLRS